MIFELLNTAKEVGNEVLCKTKEFEHLTTLSNKVKAVTKEIKGHILSLDIEKSELGE